MPATTLPTYSQAPLLQAAAAERARRAARRDRVDVGQMVLLSSDAARRVGVEPHDRFAHVAAGVAVDRRVVTLHGKTVEVKRADYVVSAQPGDRLAEGGLVIAVDPGGADRDPALLVAGSAQAEAGCDLPSVSYKEPGSSLAARPLVTFSPVRPATESDLGESCALRGCDASGEVGPSLAAVAAAEAVGPLEPGVVRAGVTPAKIGGREAVLVDFLGGLSAWVWRDLLAPSVAVGVEGDPLCDARGRLAGADLVERCRPGAAPLTQPAEPATLSPVNPAAVALQARAARPALPGGRIDSTVTAGAAPALPEGTITMSLSAAAQTCLSADPSHYSEGGVVRIGRTYQADLPGVLGEFKAHLGACRNVSLASDVSSEAADAIPGLYEVVEVRTLRYERGSAVVLRVQSDDPDGGGDELHVLAGLVEVKGGALAPAAATGGGVLATASKGAKGLVAAATSGAKTVARKTGQVAVAEGKRKALKAAKELGGDTVLDVHEGVKTVTSKLLSAFGLDKFIPAANIAADLAATSGARMLGEALQETSPKLATALVTIGETIEDKQAQRTAGAVRAALAPAVDAIKEGFGQAAGRMLAPALQSIGALPAPADDGGEEPEDDEDAAEETPPAKPAKKTAKKAGKKPAKKSKPAPAPEPAEDDTETDADAADGEED